MAKKKPKKSDDPQEEFKEEVADAFRDAGILAKGPQATGEPQPEAEGETATATATAVSTAEHEHYLQIRELNREVLAVYWKWDSAKENAAALKKELDGLRSDLTQLISRGPDPQLPLAFGDDGKPIAAADEWKSRSLNVLAISDALVEKLDENGLATLGDLKAFWDSGKPMSDCKGIGAEKSATIADAWADYSKAHPEVYGEQEKPADESGEQSTDKTQE